MDMPMGRRGFASGGAEVVWSHIVCEVAQQKSFLILEKSSRMGYYKSTRLTQKHTSVCFCVIADARIESALRHFRGVSSGNWEPGFAGARAQDLLSYFLK
jgi:hypothetical protein